MSAAMTSPTKISLEAVLSRLLRAKPQDIAAIVVDLPARQRAELAVFCYSRAHLHEIGIGIAETCDLQPLMEAAPSNAAGQVLFEQSRKRAKPEQRAAGPRGRITLAKSASGNSALAKLIASIAHDELPEPQLA
jgi:hypothetical protein